MSAEDAVLAAALQRAAALGAGDAAGLTSTLHPAFGWTTHTGLRLDRDAYVERNTGGSTEWRSQRLHEPEVVVVGDMAVLRAVAEDVVRVDEEWETFRMPVTTVWVREPDAWRCLAGHAGPRLPG